MNESIPLIASRIQSAPQQVAAAIRRSILDGSLTPGTRLPAEEDLAETFGVSRPTIRLALRSLRDVGAITTRRGRGGGTYVTFEEPSLLAHGLGENLTLSLAATELSHRELREARFGIEVFNVVRASRERRSEDLERLDELEKTRPSTSPEDWAREDALSYDLALHRWLAQCSHNPLTVAFLNATIVAFRECAFELDSVSSSVLVAHLDEVVVAVRNQDAAAAVQAMTRHLSASGCVETDQPRPVVDAAMDLTDAIALIGESVRRPSDGDVLM